MRPVYLDASAAAKLILDEPESPALFAWLQPFGDRISSALLRTELLRAGHRAGVDRLARARELVAGMLLIDIDTQTLDRAGRLDPPRLRSLDAIHLATALTLADELEAIVTYDQRMIDAARLLGLPVASPA